MARTKEVMRSLYTHLLTICIGLEASMHSSVGANCQAMPGAFLGSSEIIRGADNLHRLRSFNT
jgi:hypothetical protein